MSKKLLILCLLMFGISANSNEKIVLSSQLKTILKDKCLDCHNSKKKKGKFDMEALLKSPDSAEQWLNIHDEVMSGNMPPEDEPQLSRATKAELIKYLPKFKAQESARLLTPAEINNTLVDFFKVNKETFNAETLLKVNYSNEHFFSEQKKIISPYYIDDLYTTLDNTIDAMVDARKLPKPVTIDTFLSQTGHVSRAIMVSKKVNGEVVKVKGKEVKIKIGDLRWKWKGGGAAFSFKYPGMKENSTLPAGIYDLSFDMETMNYGRVLKDPNLGAAFKFLKDGGQFPVAIYIKGLGALGEKSIHKVIQAPIKRTNVTVRLKISSPSKIAAGLMEGPNGGSIRARVGEVYNKPGLWKGAAWPLPSVRFYNGKITGPVGQVVVDTTITGDKLNSKEVGKKLSIIQKKNFLPVYAGHLKSFEAFRKSGMSFEEAYRKTILMFFMSSKFLNLRFSENFLEQMRFSSYALLKSSPSKGFGLQFKKFTESKNGQNFVAWMIDNPHFDRFVETFTSQWLKMDHLKNSPPSKSSYPEFHHQKLAQVFPEETLHFMKYLFKENRPIHELVTANYSFLNPILHSFYKTGDDAAQALVRRGIYDNFGKYEKYQFKNQDRGGILTQGTFLTVNSNGVEGLPIRRSVWILENILHKKVPEPSVSIDIEQFETAKELAFSERLEVHRNNPICNNCHKRIDPLATLMNLYGTIGKPFHGVLASELPETAAKKKSKKKSKVPITKELVPVSRQKIVVEIDGKKISSIQGMKDYMKTQENRIAHAFLANVLKFTLGRPLELGDDKRLARIVSINKKSGLKTANLYGSFLKEYFIK